MELTKSVTYIYDKATLTWFEEIFEEYYPSFLHCFLRYATVVVAITKKGACNERAQELSFL